MANINFKFLADSTQLKKATRDVQKSFVDIEGAAKKVSFALKSAFAVTGLGLGITGVVSGLKDAAKAAVADTAAQAVLASSIRNVISVTDDQISSTEKFISSLQTKTGILDDQLRPAYSTLIRSTKDLAQSERLLSIATDVSAGSGKDLTAVTQAIAKAYNGQFTSLNKLIPGINKAADPIAELEKRFSGLAAVAANSNPLARISVIFNEIQEQIGTYLLPYLSQFADYLASPEGEQMLTKLVSTIGDVITGLGKALEILVENADTITALIVTIGALKTAWGLASLAVAAYSFVVKGATVATQGLKAALVSTGVGAIAVALGSVASGFMSVEQETKDSQAAMEGWIETAKGVYEYQGDLPVSPTNDDNKFPLNPQPGQVYTWFNYSDDKNPGVAVWWTQTWTGTTWTPAKKMTYSPKTTNTGGGDGGGGISAELERLNSAAEQVRSIGKKFRDSLDLSAGLNDTGDVFNTETALAKVRKVVAAAKKIPALLKQLKAKGASSTMIEDILGMGVIGAQATASALLSSGSLGEFIKAEQTLTMAGQSAGLISGQAPGASSYSININKANMTAEEIIKVIQAYEKKTGRKVSFGG